MSIFDFSKKKLKKNGKSDSDHNGLNTKKIILICDCNFFRKFLKLFRNILHMLTICLLMLTKTSNIFLFVIFVTIHQAKKIIMTDI